MPTFTLTSQKSGQNYDVDFERDPTDSDVDEAVTQLDADWYREQGLDPETINQGVIGTALTTIPRTFAKMGTSLVGGAAKLLDAGTAVVAKYTGTEKGGLFEGIANFTDRLDDAANDLYQVNPANAKTATVSGGATQAVGLVAGGWAAKTVGWAGGLTQVPLISGFLMGANEGVDSAKELGLETPEEQLAMGLLFGGVEMVTERLGGIGNKAATDAALSTVRKSAQQILTQAAKSVVVESGEEVLAGSAQDLLRRAFADEDPQRPGFTKSGVELPKLDRKMLERRGHEALGGAAGGAVFAGIGALSNGAAPSCPERASWRARAGG